MRKKFNKKSLIAINEESLLYKIKTFFLRLFRRKETIETKPQITNIDNNEIKSNNQRNAFMESISNIENEETRLLKLQRQFDNREIDKSQLSKEQVIDLTALYKKQISELKQSNEKRINKIRQHKDGESFLKSIKDIENEETKLLKLQQQYDNRLIETTDLPKDQINSLINLYKKQIRELSKNNAIRKERLLQYRKKLQTNS